MYLYPQTEEYMSDEAYQSIVTNDLEDDIPYTKALDKGARVFDLAEDEMISWRLNAPHRVDNQPYCVSVTTEYSTKESAFKNSVMFTNAVLRQKFGMSTRWADASMPEKYVKSVAGRALRKIGAYDNHDSEDMVTFRVDKNAPDYVVVVEPYERAF